ncbi:MAG: CopD family protein [Comamonas sp.]
MVAAATELAPLLLTTAARSASLAALATALGLVLVALLARQAWRGDAPWGQADFESRLLHTATLAGGLALGGHGLWLLAQAQAFSDASDAAGLLQAVVDTLAATGFGRGWILRALLLAAWLALSARLARHPRHSRQRAPWPLAGLAAVGAAALVQQYHAGHAAVDGGSAALALAVHVVVASAWIGALPGLLMAVARLDPAAAGRLLAAFSRAASLGVALLLASGLWQALRWVGPPADLGAWLGTAYGRAALVKLAATAVLLGLAALHRWVFLPRLREGATRVRLGLLAGIALELGVGLATFGIAGVLAGLPPARHEPSLWPYALRPDPSAWDSAYARHELWHAAALAALALAAVAALWAALRQRRRAPARAALGLALALGCTVLAATHEPPNLRLWLRPAYPSSYQHSPTGYGAESIAQGAARVARDCRIDCFTPEDDATDLSPYNPWGREDGDLYGWLLAVFDRIGHSPFAPGYIAALDPDQRWALIDYFRARVAARALSTSDARGHWRGAFPAPGLTLDCGGPAIPLDALRGRVLRIVAQAQTDSRASWLAAPAIPGLPQTLIVLHPEAPAPDGASTWPPGVCQASGAAWVAYATVAGQDPRHFDGSEIVVDANGWLRLFWPAADRPGGTEQARALREIQAQPLPAGMPRGHAH